MLETFVLAVLYGYIYLKECNVYVMPLSHEWAAVLFLYTVVDRDSVMVVFGELIKYVLVYCFRKQIL